MSSYLRQAYGALAEAGVAGTEGSLARRVVDGIVALGTFGGSSVGALSGRGSYLRQLYEALTPRIRRTDSGSYLLRLTGGGGRAFVDLIRSAIEGTQSGGEEPGAYTAQAVHLDGSAFLKTENLTAPADNGLCSIVYWFKIPTPTNGVLWVVDPNGNYPSNAYFSDPFIDHSGNTVSQQFCSFDDSSCWSADVDSLAPDGNTIFPADDQWRCILASVDTNHPDPDKVYRFYLGDDPFDFIYESAGDPGAFLPNFSGWPLYVFSDGFDGDGMVADLADFWMAPGQYIDFSIEANRRKFMDANGKPVDLGADGSTPTGTAPAVFFSGDSTTFVTNRGTGGPFELVGAVADADTSPSDSDPTPPDGFAFVTQDGEIVTQDGEPVYVPE